MKKVMVLLILGILLISPLVLAEEQTLIQEQTKIYSGFDRIIDNVKMFFSFGDAKVMKALEIREKEIDSAIINNENGENEKVDKNLEEAWEKLQFVQEKVSVNIAEKIKINSERINNKIKNEKGLSDNFEIYILEEEKTGLKAEWIIETQGKEGQTLTNEMVGVEGINEIVKEGSKEQIKVREIETRMIEIDDEIKNWVVENVVKGEEGDDGLTWEVVNKIVEENGDDGLIWEVKTVVDSGDQNNDVSNNVVDGGMASGTIKDSPSNTIIEDNVIDGDSNDVVDSSNIVVDEVAKTKDNEDVTPAPNVVDDDVAPGPQGIVGDQGYSDGEGHHGDVLDDTSGASGEIDEN